jgi:hypothetical protein
MRSASHVGTSGSRPAAAVPPAALARHGGGVNLTQDADAQPQRWGGSRCEEYGLRWISKQMAADGLEIGDSEDVAWGWWVVKLGAGPSRDGTRSGRGLCDGRWVVGAIDNVLCFRCLCEDY